MAEQRPQAQAQPKPQEPQQGKPQEPLSPEQERAKMMAEGTKPYVKAKAVKAVATTTSSESPPPTEPAEIPVPEGVTLVIEPYIASELGKLVIEPRMVSTGGVVHPETEPASLTPSLPGNAPVATPSGTPAKAS